MSSRTWGQLHLAPEQGGAYFAGQPLPLSATEVVLLARLMDHLGEFVASAQLPASGAELASTVDHLNDVLERTCGAGYAVMHLPGSGHALALPGLAPDPATSHRGGGAHGFPRLRHRLIGREAVSGELARQLAQARLITLVGAGGVGKTTVAVDVASREVAVFRDGGCFIDFSYLASGQMVAAAVAAELRMSAPGSMSVADVVGHLRGRQMLLVLDNCEHVVEHVTVLCEAIFKAAPYCHVLATSREPLRARGETVVRLPSLAVPAEQARVSAAEAMRYPAVQLFVERRGVRRPGYRLQDDESALVAGLCQQVDGLPLALELVAALAERHSLLALSQRLARAPLTLRNEAQPQSARHQSLATLFAWSHELLSPLERRTFEQLSIFRSSFTLASAAAVAGAGPSTLAQVSAAVLSLAQKSLVVLEPTPDGPRCRYLETTRAFAFEKLNSDPGEAEAVARCHAQHLVSIFDDARRAEHVLDRADWRRVYGPWINDVRAALAWCFSEGGDPMLGVELTVASADLAPQLSLWNEYWHHHERAVKWLDRTRAPLAPRTEMMLRNAYAQFLGQNRGPVAEMRRNYDLCQRLAANAGDAAAIDMANDGAWMSAYLSGDYPQTMAHVVACRASSGEGLATAAQLRTARMLAQTLHAMARHDEARDMTERLLDAANNARRVAESAIDPQVSGRVVLARIHWLQGRADAAAEVMAEALVRAENDTSASFAHATAWGALPVALWRGDRKLAQRLNQRLAEHCASFHLPYWASWTLIYRSALQGTLAPGATGWDEEETDDKRHDMLVTLAPFAITPASLARALGGQTPWCAAEILRVEGERQRALGQAGRARDFFELALATADAQRAPAWSLRALTSLVRLDGAELNRDRLEARYGSFSEGHATHDLRAARALLDGDPSAAAAR